MLAQTTPSAQTENPSRYIIAQYQVPSEDRSQCMTQGQFVQELESRLGQVVPTQRPASSPALSFSIVVQRKKSTGPRKYQLLLLVDRDIAGNAQSQTMRSIHAKHCNALLSSAAIIMSLALEPTLLYNNEKPKEEKPREEGPSETSFLTDRQKEDLETPSFLQSAFSTQSSQASSQARIKNQANPVQLSLQISAIADHGTFVRTALGIGIGFTSQWKEYRLSFRMARWGRQRTFLQTTPRLKGARFDYLSGTLGLCRRLWNDGATAGLCGIAGMGRLSAEGVVDLPRSDAHLMGNLGMGWFIEIPVHLARIRIGGELVAQLIRPRYHAKIKLKNQPFPTQIQIHQPDMLSARLVASWGLSF